MLYIYLLLAKFFRIFAGFPKTSYCRVTVVLCNIAWESALTFSPPAFGPSENSTHTFWSMDTGSQKCLVLVTNVPQSGPTVRPPHKQGSQEKLDLLFVNITRSHCNYGQPNLVTYV